MADIQMAPQERILFLEDEVGLLLFLVPIRDDIDSLILTDGSRIGDLFLELTEEDVEEGGITKQEIRDMDLLQDAMWAGLHNLVGRKVEKGELVVDLAAELRKRRLG
jgi:hypothetical protein